MLSLTFFFKLALHQKYIKRARGRDTNAAIFQLKLFSHLLPVPVTPLHRNFEWAHFTCCALWTFPLSRLYCPDRTLCSSIKVQNNTSVFQSWKGQWQLQSSARWLCILINQQGGSRPCLPPHAVWSGAWRSLARPLLSPLWSWLNRPKRRATPHVTTKSSPRSWVQAEKEGL